MEKKKLGRGAYGSVRKIIDTSDGTAYALKIQPLIEDGDFSSHLLREIAVMRRMCQPSRSASSIIALLGIIHIPGKGGKHEIGMIMPLAQGDLYHMDIEKRPRIQKARYAYQLTCAVAYLHSRDILHRDIKPHNILYDASDDRMLLADFGLVRSLHCASSHTGMTNEVFTLNYRPPEILLSGSKYNSSADVWALGCVLYEIMQGQGSESARVLFPGDSEIDQLYHIFRQLGTPTEEMWPGVTNFPEWKPFPKWKPNTHGPLFTTDRKTGLFNECFTHNPAKRISALELLDAGYFDKVRDREIEPVALTCLDNLYLCEPSVLKPPAKPRRRDAVVDWLMQVSKALRQRRRTFFMACYLLDRYYTPESAIDSNHMIAWAAACLYVAGIYIEVYGPQISEMLYMGRQTFNREETDYDGNREGRFRDTIKEVLDRCNYNLIFSTSSDFLDQYCSEFYSEEIALLARPFLHLGLFQPLMYVYTPHEQALWAIYWACQYHETPYKHESLLSAASITQYPLRGPANAKLTQAVDMINPKTSISWDAITLKLGE